MVLDAARAMLTSGMLDAEAIPATPAALSSVLRSIRLVGPLVDLSLILSVMDSLLQWQMSRQFRSCLSSSGCWSMDRFAADRREFRQRSFDDLARNVADDEDEPRASVRRRPAL